MTETDLTRSEADLIRLAEMANTDRVRVTRTIVLEGPAEWVRATLDKSWLAKPGLRVVWAGLAADTGERRQAECSSLTVEAIHA